MRFQCLHVCVKKFLRSNVIKIKGGVTVTMAANNRFLSKLYLKNKMSQNKFHMIFCRNVRALSFRKNFLLNFFSQLQIYFFLAHVTMLEVF